MLLQPGQQRGVTAGVVAHGLAPELASGIQKHDIQLELGDIDPNPRSKVLVHRIGPSSYAGLATKRWPKLPFGLVERRTVGRANLTHGLGLKGLAQVHAGIVPTGQVNRIIVNPG
jgi:hypothetical protein